LAVLVPGLRHRLCGQGFAQPGAKQTDLRAVGPGDEQHQPASRQAGANRSDVKQTQPTLPFDPRPLEITTESSQEFFALLDRKDLVVLSAERDGNGRWRC